MDQTSRWQPTDQPCVYCGAPLYRPTAAALAAQSKRPSRLDFEMRCFNKECHFGA